MIIYNITTKVSWHIHDNWNEWLLTVQLPKVMSTGLFERFQLVRLLEIDDEDGPTYAVQLYASSLQHINAYKGKHLEEIAEQEHDAWGTDIISFHTLMEVIN